MTYLSAIFHVIDEIPAGSGVNFTLAHTPLGSVKIYRGGVLQSIVNGDYSLAGPNLTLTSPLQASETLIAEYLFTV